MAKDIVVISILGSSLDRGFNQKRWLRWRPTPSLVAHPDEFPVSRVELLYTDKAHEDVLGVVCGDVVEKSPVTEVKSHLLEVPDPWDFNAMYGALFDFARSYPFDTEREEYYLQMATGSHVAKICLFLLAESRLIPAKLVTSRPLGGDDADVWRGAVNVVDLQLSRYDAIASRFEKMAQTFGDVLRNGIQTRNPVFNELITEVEQVCLRSSAPMLVTGPTGAGKSQLVSRVFELRRANNRIHGEFVEVNCATLRGDNAMSALFGHKKGAYTGAISDRKGLLLEADGGILFLDEIGELGLEEQAVLLRALEDKRFTPLGSDKAVRSDFQLVAGTNRDLHAEVQAGRFRSDLLARLNVWSFRLPSLAERREDIEPNVEHELRRMSKELQRVVSFSASAHKLFMDFALQAPWPGNFRDLRASVERMATLAAGGRIDDDCVTAELKRLGASWGNHSAAPARVQPLADAHVAVDKSSVSLYWVKHVLGDAADELSPLDALTLNALIAEVAVADSAADVGRRLLCAPGGSDKKVNYSDRAKKTLARFGLEFSSLKTMLALGTARTVVNGPNVSE